MYHVLVLIALGPCAIMALATLAMVILSGTLARTRHARLWALSFAIYAAEWGLISALHANPAAPRHFTTVVSLLATAGVFCYYAGFQQRRRETQPVRLVIGATLVVIVQLALLLPAQDQALAFTGQVFFPAVRATLFLLAVPLVTPDRGQASATERSTICMLLGVALINSAIIAFVALQHLGRLPAGTALRFSSYVSTPVAAAMGLFTLLLIASDFSRERLRLIHTDPLTGVLNRMGFEHATRRLMTGRASRVMALAVTDIDRFKTINDRFGHLTGDAALIGFARRLVDGAPASALVSRFGGEEFVLLFDRHDAAAAAACVEAIREGLPGITVPGNEDVHFTASFGVAERRPRESIDSLYSRADAALYRSKQLGRDRTTVAEAS